MVTILSCVTGLLMLVIGLILMRHHDEKKTAEVEHARELGNLRSVIRDQAYEMTELEETAEEYLQHRVPEMLTIAEAAAKAGIEPEALRGRIRRARGRGAWQPFDRLGEGRRGTLYAFEDELDRWVRSWQGRRRLRQASGSDDDDE